MKTLKEYIAEVKVVDVAEPSKEALNEWNKFIKSKSSKVEWDIFTYDTYNMKVSLESEALAEYFCSGIEGARIQDWQGEVKVELSFNTWGIFFNDLGWGFPERINVRVGNVASYLYFCKKSDIRAIAKNLSSKHQNLIQDHNMI